MTTCKSALRWEPGPKRDLTTKWDCKSDYFSYHKISYGWKSDSNKVTETITTTKKQETFSSWGRKIFPIDSAVYLSGNVGTTLTFS